MLLDLVSKRFTCLPSSVVVPGVVIEGPLYSLHFSSGRLGKEGRGSCEEVLECLRLTETSVVLPLLVSLTDFDICRGFVPVVINRHPRVRDVFVVTPHYSLSRLSRGYLTDDPPWDRTLESLVLSLCCKGVTFSYILQGCDL